MKKDVMVTIAGVHTEADAEEYFEEKPIEVISRGTYYNKDGIHYVFTEEYIPEEGTSIKTRIQIQEGKIVQIFKSGAINTHLYFEEGRLIQCHYQTDYGILRMTVYTTEVMLDLEEDELRLRVNYSICMEGQPQQDCIIRMRASSKEKNSFSLREYMTF